MFHPGDGIGPYTLLRTLGRGAFGEVWLAERRSSLLTTQVALKLPLDDTTDLEAIRQEAQVWLKASGHPNIVPVLEAEVYNGQVVIASEYVAGGSLAAWMAQHGGKSPSDDAAIGVMRGILAGLEHLHENQLIHRDLKPDNVLLQSSSPRLTDFGLSRVLEPSGNTTHLAGTPGYMAPEAFQGRYSVASDLWSAGLLLHELLTGELPFAQTDFYSLLMAITSEEPVRISERVSDALQPVLKRALSKRPDERFASAAEMAEALSEAVTAASPVQFAAPRSQRPLHNLPVQTTTFVGREKEISEVKTALLKTRLLTLTAIGGTGKSRLSLQVAADLLDEYPDGVWLVELAALTEPALVAPTVARMLNIAEVPEEPGLQTLTKALKSRRLLLLLDNCEHLLPACAELADALLRYCPGVTLLASSREALNINGEVLYTLHALAAPDLRTTHTIESLAQYDAVRLFLDRATVVRPEFAVTNQNAAALAQICHRLDGIPLALELAAARVRSLSLEEINKRLDNRFRLLTGGSRNALPRQQTLRALIDWSYDLLNSQEQQLLARLSTFSGGWTLAAAEAVCAGGVIEDWEVFDLLTALADKSLVVCETEAENVRFRLLETLREYSREKLEEMHEVEATAERHAQYYAGMVNRKVRPETEGGETDFAYLLAEADNVRSAMDWLWSAGQIETAARISVDLRQFWTRKGWNREADGYLKRVLEHRDSLGDKALCARVLKDAGWFAYLLGEIHTAEQLTEASVETAFAAGAKEIQANALNGLALIVQSLNDFERAEPLFMQAIELLRETRQEIVLADYLMNLGLLQSMQGKHEAAQSLFSEARSIYARRSDEHGMAVLLCNQSDLALRQSNWQEAELLAEQSLARFRLIEHRLGTAYSLANLAKAASRQQKHPTAVATVQEAVSICVDANLWDLMPMLIIIQAESCLEQGKIEDAAILHAGAVRLRALLEIPPKAEEQLDLSLLEARLRERATDEMLDAAQKLFSESGTDELISRLLSRFWFALQFPPPV